MSSFQQTKIWLVQLLGLPKDALHIYAGLTIFFLTLLLFQLPMRSWKPLGAVVLAALAGEAWDLIDSHRAGAGPALARNWHDIWNTCFWPAILFLLARYTRAFRR